MVSAPIAVPITGKLFMRLAVVVAVLPGLLLPRGW